jgi:hypothetical protein
LLVAQVVPVLAVQAPSIAPEFLWHPINVSLVFSFCRVFFF